MLKVSSEVVMTAASGEAPRRCCTKCQAEYPALPEFFYRNARGLFGLNAECKTCSNARKCHTRAKNPEKYRAINREHNKRYPSKNYARVKAWRKKNPDHWHGYVHAYRARRQNAEGSFTEAHLDACRSLQAGRCYFCDEVMGENETIEHLQPLSRDGTNWPSNIVLACHRCNCQKGDMTVEEFQAVRLQVPVTV